MNHGEIIIQDAVDKSTIIWMIVRSRPYGSTRPARFGHLYDAKTSPQMIVINPQGVVIHDGAIDDKPTTDLNDVPGATNCVSLALGQAIAGTQVETPATRPYGCSVKYADSMH